MAGHYHFYQLFLQCSALVTIAQATIECMCTTSDCLRDEKSSCMATYTCYVQYMAPGGPEQGNGSIIRGCIDDSTPLLCENRRPQAFTGSWPVLHCCQEDWCNKDVLPTPPAWLHEVPEIDESQEHTDVEEDSYFDEDDYIYTQIESARDTDLNRARRSRTINPLYVAVPVAGACVLLAIIIFAIFVLRRQNNYMEEYRYPTTLVRGHPPPCCQDKKCMYAESERSSTGSETKLLVRV